MEQPHIWRWSTPIQTLVKSCNSSRISLCKTCSCPCWGKVRISSCKGQYKMTDHASLWRWVGRPIQETLEICQPRPTFRLPTPMPPWSRSNFPPLAAPVAPAVASAPDPHTINFNLQMLHSSFQYPYWPSSSIWKCMAWNPDSDEVKGMLEDARRRQEWAHRRLMNTLHVILSFKKRDLRLAFTTRHSSTEPVPIGSNGKD